MPVQLRRVAAALILPAVLVTAACGKQAEPTPGTSAAAASTTAATGTSAASTSDAAPTSAQPYQDKAALIAGLKSGAASATSAHVTMDMGPQMKLEMLLVGDQAYIKGIPGIPDGKWGVVDSSSDVGRQLESSLAQADPTKMYDQFEKGVTAVKPLGEESVDGDPTHKYELTLDTTAIAQSSPDAAQLPDTITYTAWIDDANHLRKVTFDVLGSQATMTMSKYGEPVDITAPAAGNTVKAPL